MCLIKQRAKNPEQKALRRQHILDATRLRFKSLSYEEVNLNHVASDIGITKAALYRYFRNKETLFLALFVKSLKELIKCSEQILQSELELKTRSKQSLSLHPKSDSPLALMITKSLVENPVYCKLSAILHTILERNLTPHEASEFKHELLTLMSQYSQLLIDNPEFKRIFPTKNTKDALSYLMQVQQALIGVWHMTHPVGAIAQVIEETPLDIFKQDFNETLLTHISKITKP